MRAHADIKVLRCTIAAANIQDKLLSPLGGVPACGIEHGTDRGKQNPPVLSIARGDSGRQSLRITLGPLRRDILGNARRGNRSCDVRPLTKRTGIAAIESIITMSVDDSATISVCSLSPFGER